MALKKEAEAKAPRKKRKPRSELRKIVNRLNEDLDKAFENIKASLNGQQVDKETLATSKWWLEKVITTTNAAISEETKRVQIRKQLDDGTEEVIEMDEEEAERPKGAVFSLVVPKKDN
jgi:hypothetical protein